MDNVIGMQYSIPYDVGFKHPIFQRLFYLHTHEIILCNRIVGDKIAVILHTGIIGRIIGKITYFSTKVCTYQNTYNITYGGYIHVY